MAYSPTPEHVSQVLDILYNNGIAVTNSRQAYEALRQYEADPNFSAILAFILSHNDNPLPGAQRASWLQFRQLAGLTLKNNLERSKAQLGVDAITSAAAVAIGILRNPPSLPLVRVAAQITVKITSIVGLDWWNQPLGAGGLATLLLGELMQSSHALGSLYCLQYLLEDVPRQIGGASQVIVSRVMSMAVEPQVELNLRKAAFKVACHPFELGNHLDWNVDSLSPMQEGLMNVSQEFASGCTKLVQDVHVQQDTTFLVAVLRALGLLVDYVDSIFPPGHDHKEMVSIWMAAAMHFLCSSHHKEESIAAADFLANVLVAYERSGGEGSIFDVAHAVLPFFPQLVAKCFEFIVMTPEEIQAIELADSYLLRDAHAVRTTTKAGGGIDATDSLDDDEAAITLRKSASCLLDQANAFNSHQAFPLVLSNVSQRWASSQWTEREAALLGFGASVRGSITEAIPHIPAVLTQLKQFIDNMEENVCVVSMSVWCVQRLLPWLLSDGQQYVEAILLSIISRLESPSKRIQNSSSTAIIQALTRAYNAQYSVSQTVVHTLAEKIHRCLPFYNTGPLANLADCSLLVMGLLDDSKLKTFIDPFVPLRAERMQEFVTTYQQSVVHGTPNVMINKDVISLDRVIVAYFLRCFNAEQCTQLLSTWSDVLNDIASRGAYDDADLVYNSVYTAGHLVRACDTQTLLRWLDGRQHDILRSVLTILEQASSNELVRGSALTLLFNVATVGREACFQDQSLVARVLSASVALLASFGENDASLVYSVAQVLCLVIQMSPSAQTLAALQELCKYIRADVFAESYDYHLATALALVNVLNVHPQLIDSMPISNIAQLMAQASNDEDKVPPTVSLCTAITSMTNVAVLQSALPMLLRFVYSWQQAAPKLAFDALGTMLHAARQKCGSVFEQCIGTQSAAFQSQFRQMYQL